MTSTRIVGSLRRTEDGKGVVRLEDLYETDIEDLWSALTDPHRLARWLADVNGDLRLGGRIRARFTSSWEGPGRIDICEAPHHLAVTLSPGASDETIIDAVLVAEHDRTRLVIEERGLPMAELAGHGAGWQAHVEDLATHLAGREPGDWHTRWTTLIPVYEDLSRDLA